MEDDVMLEDNFMSLTNKAIKNIEQKNVPNPILYLDHIVAKWGNGAAQPISDSYKIHDITYTWNTGCYILWPSTTKTILNNMRIEEPVDNFLARLAYYDKINAFGTYPALATQFCNHCDGDIIHT